MGAYKYLMIHCTATPEGRLVQPRHIEQWHMGALDLPNGKVRFKGKTYQSRSSLPLEKVGGILARSSNGRGWDRVGYSKMFMEDGKIHDFVDHNEDNWISSNEITYGAVGFNSVTKNFVYAGGLGNSYIGGGGKRRYPVKNTLKMVQEWHLMAAIRYELRKHPQIKIIGHNQTSVKACPSFDARELCRIYGFLEKNIDQRDVRVKLPSLI